MPVPDEGWFVQMPIVGTILGPMPLDALTEMVRTGALLRHDLVRRNTSGDWRSASELPELSAEFSVPLPSFEATESLRNDPLALAVAGPNHDEIDSAAERLLSADPVSTQPNPLDFDTAAESSVAMTSGVMPEAEPLADATLPTTPSETTRAPASVTASDNPLDETDLANRPSWSAPAPVLRPAPRRIIPTKTDRGPSTLAKFSAALSELTALLRKPLDNRLVIAVAVLALLVWYFFPASQPTRRPPPKTAEVTGVIRLNGKPVSNALVTFHPDRKQGTVGPPSVGRTDAAGKFKLTIDQSHSGAVVGKHQIAVLSGESAGMAANGYASSGSVPEHYAQVETSQLATEVLPGQRNEITLDLTSN